MQKTALPYIDVRDFGAVGDGRTDDAAAIQSAIDSTQRGDWLIIPAGEYALSKRLVVSTPDMIFRGQGTLVPHGDMSDYLVEFRKGPRESVDFERDSIGLRLVVECLRLNAMGQAKGIFFNGLFHCGISNVSIMRTHGTAARFHDVRESDFYQMNINHSCSYDEPLIDIAYTHGKEPCPFGGGWQWLENKVVDGQNNIRFFGLNLVHVTAFTYIDIGGDTAKSPNIAAWPARAIHFSGCQLHLSESNWLKEGWEDPDEAGLRTLDWDTHSIHLAEAQTLCRIRNAASITFSQCNFPNSHRPQDTCIQLGDAHGKAVDVSFLGCRMPHLPPFRADNCRRVQAYGCTLGVQPWEPDIKERPLEDIVVGPCASHVKIL